MLPRGFLHSLAVRLRQEHRSPLLPVLPFHMVGGGCVCSVACVRLRVCHVTNWLGKLFFLGFAIVVASITIMLVRESYTRETRECIWIVREKRRMGSC